jgi:hypothetical protein
LGICCAETAAAPDASIATRTILDTDGIDI